MTEVPAAEILTHRIIWSCVLLLACRWRPGSGTRYSALRQPRQLLNLTLSALLVAGNWLLFIWSVNHNYLRSQPAATSIRCSIFCRHAVFGERLRRLQWVAVALATLAYWIQVVLIGRSVVDCADAGRFIRHSGGLIRKQIPVEAPSAAGSSKPCCC